MDVKIVNKYASHYNRQFLLLCNVESTCGLLILSFLYMYFASVVLTVFHSRFIVDRSHDFSIGKFDDRTVILCDQVLS